MTIDAKGVLHSEGYHKISMHKHYNHQPCNPWLVKLDRWFPLDKAGVFKDKGQSSPPGCPRKLGSMVRINGLFHLLINDMYVYMCNIIYRYIYFYIYILRL